MHGHVWSFNQSQTWKSHTDVWTWVKSRPRVIFLIFLKIFYHSLFILFIFLFIIIIIIIILIFFFFFFFWFVRGPLRTPPTSGARAAICGCLDYSIHSKNWPTLGQYWACKSDFSCVEGFTTRYAPRTYALRPGRHVGFLWNNKICFNFVSIIFEKIKLTVSERTYIIVPMV